MMKETTKEYLAASIRHFHLPRYEEIPNVGLYLEQTTKYIQEYLCPILDGALTSSMISNYVKKHLISNPVKKQYSRDQIAYLFFIAVAKSVLSLDGLINFISVQRSTYDLKTAYNYFATELENLLLYTFEAKDILDTVGQDDTDETRLLYSCIVAVTQTIYLEKCLAAIVQEQTS